MADQDPKPRHIMDWPEERFAWHHGGFSPSIVIIDAASLAWGVLMLLWWRSVSAPEPGVGLTLWFVVISIVALAQLYFSLVRTFYELVERWSVLSWASRLIVPGMALAGALLIAIPALISLSRGVG
jgi:hypothetical protein